MTEKEKMLAGLLYRPWDEELQKEFHNNRRLTRLYNQTTEDEEEKREKLLREILGGAGKDPHIETPFRCDYGIHIHVGDYFYANYNFIVLDVCEVHIGDNVMFGPNVGIYTAGHPLDADIRVSGLEFGSPVTIGNNVWFGGNVVVNPGVTIGDNTVIGSGSVITKSIPANVVAAGNPCRVIRKITEEDKEYWEEQKRKGMPR